MNINRVLHRQILSGIEYVPLFPKATGKSEALGSGNTFHSVKLMTNIIDKYSFQAKNIAKLLEQNSVSETCERIYSWLYNHIQYKADGINQLLRTPSNSFENRSIGIDCKSYSIFASCILKELGIKHFIRQIKQPTHNPSAFTHVYVVVPMNQETGDLQNGYFVIDATTSTNREPIYTMKDDTAVKLPHFGLNAVAKQPKKSVAKNNTNRNIVVSALSFIAGVFLFQKK